MTIIVPLTPGTTADIIARIYGDAVGQRVGQLMVVVNKAGAGGMIAAQTTTAAAPDGYTIQLANSVHAINGVLSKNLRSSRPARTCGARRQGRRGEAALHTHARGPTWRGRS